MKKIAIVGLLLLSGCGMAEHASQFCGGDLEQMCHALVGGKADEEQDSRLSDLEKKVSALEMSNTQTMSQIEVLELMLDDTSVDVTTVESIITVLNSTVSTNTAQIYQLTQNHNVTKIVDPCGNGPGFDEVLLRTSSGQLVASFSENTNGKNTRFTLLSPGTYQTTDQTGCTFTINSDMSITSSPATVEL